MYSFHVPITTLHLEPDERAECVTEGLFGEDYIIVAEKDDCWLEIKLCQDQYTGYIRTPAVYSHRPSNFRVCTRSSLLFEAPSIKSRIVSRLPFNAELNVVDSSNPEFHKTGDGLYVWHEHVCATSSVDSRDPVALAQSCFHGAPYVWGGRTPAGADCSGMIQSVFHACGRALPRDSHQQENAIDLSIDHESRQRGDLVFWPGHVGLLIKPDELVHATAHTLDSCVESLDEVIKRAGKISSIKRLT